MSIIFLSNTKKVKKFIKSLNKEEIKNCKFFIISDDTSLDPIDLLPKKAKYKYLKLLLPPSDVVTNFIIKGDKDKYLERYYQYLSRPLCHAAMNKIAKDCFVDGYISVVCFGDIENEFHIPKYIKRAFEMILPDVEVFNYTDYKNDPQSVLDYRCDNIDNIIRQVLEDSRVIGQKLKELDQCKNKYDDNDFYGG